MPSRSGPPRWRMPDGTMVEAMTETAARDWWLYQQERARPKRGELHEIGEATVHLTNWLRQAYRLEPGDVRIWRCQHGEVIAAPRSWVRDRLVYCDVGHIFQSGAASGHEWNGQHSRDGLSFADQCREWARQHEEAPGAAGRR